jgi:putative membrane protein
VTAPARVEHDRVRRLAGRVAGPLLWAHVALVGLSTAALVTFLADPSPAMSAWLAREPNATAARIGWAYSGPSYVVLGFLAALAHALRWIGGWRVAAMFAVASLIALASELLGTSTGYPFGGYSYTPLLGYRILGLVPFPIPISWTFILYCSLAMCGRLLPARDDGRTRLLWAFVAGLILTAWDVAMDPAMVRTAHWLWHEPGPFYGMPLTNWIGWVVTGTVIAWVMLRFVPPTTVAERVSPTRLPLVLYAVNGLMPIAICFRHGMLWAGVLGTVAMAVPLVLATAAPARRPSPARAAGTAAAPVSVGGR